MGMGSALPDSIADVLSIPSALTALRTSLAPGTVDLFRAARAVVALGLVVALATFFVRRDALLVNRTRGRRVIALESVHAREGGGRAKSRRSSRT